MLLLTLSLNSSGSSYERASKSVECSPEMPCKTGFLSLSKRDIKKFTKGGKINIVDGGGGLNLALPAPFSHINIDVPRELCYDRRRAP